MRNFLRVHGHRPHVGTSIHATGNHVIFGLGWTFFSHHIYSVRNFCQCVEILLKNQCIIKLYQIRPYTANTITFLGSLAVAFFLQLIYDMFVGYVLKSRERHFNDNPRCLSWWSPKSSYYIQGWRNPLIEIHVMFFYMDNKELTM